MRWKIIFVFVFFAVLLNFAGASFNFSEIGTSINTEYGVLDSLKAKINISFDNESLGSDFEDSLSNSINLSVLLTKIANFNYTINEMYNTITSDFHLISLDSAEFILPNATGILTYQLNFSGEEILEQEIEIIDTSSSIKNQIDEKYDMLNNTKNEIKDFDLSIRKVLNERLDFDSLENLLNEIEVQYESASSEEYDAILENLSSIEIPETITKISEANSVSFYLSSYYVDLDVLETIAGGSYPEEEESEYVDGLILWYQDNLETELTFNEISVIYDSNEDETIRIFNFDFDKRNLEDEAYFIVEDLQDIVFAEDYSEQSSGGYLYFSLDGISEVSFSTEQNIDFLNVPVFIAPALSDIEPIEAGTYTDTEKENKRSKWVLFGLILFLLILIGVVAYIIIQTWYRRRYENYLFKNRNNLFNIMNYIQVAKKRGMSRGNIIKNLRKSNWKNEQINYALNKYEGKKIAGIIEKPFKKVLKKIEQQKK